MSDARFNVVFSGQLVVCGPGHSESQFGRVFRWMPPGLKSCFLASPWC